MTPNEFLTNAGLIAAAMGLLSLLEFAVPLFSRGDRSRGRLPANLGLTALTLLLNWAVISTLGVAATVLEAERGGLLAALGLSMPALVVVGVVTLDLSTYAAHLSMHRSAMLWRIHKVHHSDPFLDVSSALRQHPIEGLWRFIWIAVPTLVLGIPAIGLFIYRLLSVIQALLEHANIRVFASIDSAISLVWVTPNMHKVHHSRIRDETDTNYGNLFSLFDRAFGSFTPSVRAFGVVYGLDDVGAVRARSLPGLLALPFAPDSAAR